MNKPTFGVFRWRACVPQGFDRWTFDPSDPLWIARHDSPIPKVAIPRSLFEKRPTIGPAQGSHSVVDANDRAIAERGAVLGHFLHIPIRSRQQFLQKVFTSAFANLAKNNAMVVEGRHKRRLLEVIAERDLSDMTLTSIAAQFPMRPNEFEWLTDTEQFVRTGFRRSVLNVPFLDLSLPSPGRPDLHRIIARCLQEFSLEDVAANDGSLVIDGNVVRYVARAAAAD